MALSKITKTILNISIIIIIIFLIIAGFAIYSGIHENGFNNSCPCYTRNIELGILNYIKENKINKSFIINNTEILRNTISSEVGTNDIRAFKCPLDFKNRFPYYVIYSKNTKQVKVYCENPKCSNFIKRKK